MNAPSPMDLFDLFDYTPAPFTSPDWTPLTVDRKRKPIENETMNDIQALFETRSETNPPS
jgi:hypothetical protein